MALDHLAPGNRRRLWEDNIKIYLSDVGCDDVNANELAFVNIRPVVPM
jgi:hypothetical protein